MFRQLKSSGWSFNDDAVVDAARAISFPAQKSAGPPLAEAVRATGRPRVLLSYDALCGDPYTSFADRQAVLERLAAACAGLQVRVLLVVRRQAEWIESLFRQSLQEYYYTPFRKVLVWPEAASAARAYPRLIVDQLDWARMAEGFAGAFGSGSVTVLPYELLVQDAAGFVSRLGRHFGERFSVADPSERVNRGYGALSCRIALYLNPLVREKSRFGFLPNRPFYYALKARRHRRIYSRLFRWSSRMSLRYILQNYVDRYLWSPPRLLAPEEKARVMRICAEANARLAAFTDADLAPLGYSAGS